MSDNDELKPKQEPSEDIAESIDKGDASAFIVEMDYQEAEVMILAFLLGGGTVNLDGGPEKDEILSSEQIGNWIVEQRKDKAGIEYTAIILVE